MATQVVMPKLSPTMEEGQLSRWLKKEGDPVSMGEPIAEIDTDKATMEMQALGNGVLRKILIKEGESAPLGQLIAIIGEADEDISAMLKGGAPASGGKAADVSPAPEPSTQPQQTDAPTKAAGSAPATQPPSSDGKATPASAPAESGGRLVVSPIAARMAAESGINLGSVKGSGPGGRIIKRDVEAALSAGGTAGKAEAGSPQRQSRAVKSGAPAEESVIRGASPFRDVPMSEMRRTIARRLVTSIGPVPHFFLTTEIEMDRSADLREALKEVYPQQKISLNDIVIKAVAWALIQNPDVNASFQDKVIRYYEHADIGVAVATDNGLITPVIRSADLKSISEINSEIRELAERARARKLTPDEYTGATFSVSNLGMYGIDEFTAVINPPEGAILAVGAMTPKAVVKNNEISIRQMMRVTMSCDHRVIDGAVGAEFLQAFKKAMENPLYLVVPDAG
ncbi:MAG: pyruvate dehydrogenase complex dihydrolipoamide acetyltransferase [Pyrinomonadaceae bacterium]